MMTLLAIDDDDAILYTFRRTLQAPGCEILTASDGAEGLDLVRRHRPAVVFLDLNLPRLPGLEVFRRIREIDARILVIIITAERTSETVIEAMKQGAFDYVTKPFDLGRIRDLVGRARQVSDLMAVPVTMPQDEAIPEPADALVGLSPPMKEVYKAIGRVAPQDVNVLIRGESGTGKELVARAVYQHSRRADGPFLALNCAAIPETLLETELFGHESGAFTGADRRRIGKFEQAAGGTLFLDEVGDMTPLSQAKVLRVLQERTFERVGGGETIRADVRIIAATHRDLESMVREGTFRADLYYRLGVFTITLPPLRDRLGDIETLVDHFLARFRRELNRNVRHAAPEALEALRRHTWPGHVRELQSVLKQAVLHAQGPVLLAEHLPPLSAAPAPPPSAAPAPERAAPAWSQFVEDRLRAGSTGLHAEAVAATERAVIGHVLRHTDGNQVKAAQILGITRGTLRTKILSLKIPIDGAGWSEIDHPADR